MYEGMFQGKKTASERSGRITERENPTKMQQCFEDRPEYSFDNVRIYYSAGESAGDGAPAYTRGAPIYSAPGQERFWGRERAHVVQRMERRVRPAFRGGNIPFHHYAALEREADSRRSLAENVAPVPDEGRVMGQGVLQGQFVKVLFGKSVYEKKIREVLGELYEVLVKFQEQLEDPCEEKNEYQKILEKCDSEEKLYDEFMRDEGEESGYDILMPIFQGILTNLTENEKENEADVKKVKSGIARLDILLDFIKHFDGETGSSEPRYEHYHMYSADTRLEEGEMVDEGANLLAAVDCCIRDVEKIGSNVLWIESFISFEKGKGGELLRDILAYLEETEESEEIEETEKAKEKEKAKEAGIKGKNVEYVALGAYLGTEGYYTKTLGMQKCDDLYIDSDGETFMTWEDVDKKYINVGGSDEEGQTREELTKEEKRRLEEKFMREGCFYPVYFKKIR